MWQNRRHAGARLQRSASQAQIRLRRLEGDWVGSYASPHVPQREQLGLVRVLDRPAVSSKSSKDGCTIAKETESQQAGMVEQAFDDPDKRAKRKAVARREGRW